MKWKARNTERIARNDTRSGGIADTAEKGDTSSTDSAKMQSTPYGPIRNRARTNSHPRSEPTGYHSIRLDRIQIIHTLVQPPSKGIRIDPTGCVSLTNSHSLWHISAANSYNQNLLSCRENPLAERATAQRYCSASSFKETQPIIGG